MTLKTRVKVQHFADGNSPVGSVKVTTSWIVEAWVQNRYRVMGDTNGIRRFETRELAQQWADELSATQSINIS